LQNIKKVLTKVRRLRA